MRICAELQCFLFISYLFFHVSINVRVGVSFTTVGETKRTNARSRGLQSEKVGRIAMFSFSFLRVSFMFPFKLQLVFLVRLEQQRKGWIQRHGNKMMKRAILNCLSFISSSLWLYFPFPLLLLYIFTFLIHLSQERQGIQRE